MFEQILTGRGHRMEPREAFFALLSLFFHATGIASLLAASWLSLAPIPLPKLHPELVAPVVFPRAGAPAPRLGGGGVHATIFKAATADKKQEVRQPEENLA